MAAHYTGKMTRKTIPPRGGLKARGAAKFRSARARPKTNPKRASQPKSHQPKSHKNSQKSRPKSRPGGRARHDAVAPGKRWTAEQINEAFRRFEAAESHPRGELEHQNPYTLLVAVVLSAQATDAGVNKATRALFAVADTPEKMLALGEERLREAIRTIGLYVTKAKNVIALSRQLIERHHGRVPHDRAALEALPGVGRKTANVVLNTAFGAPTIAVDTHVFRVSNRTGLAPGLTPGEVEAALEARVPAAYKPHAHHWLILHGR